MVDDTPHAALTSLALRSRWRAGVERALFNMQQVVRRLLNALHQCVAVQRFALQEAQDHHLERAGEEVARFGSRHGDRGPETDTEARSDKA